MYATKAQTIFNFYKSMCHLLKKKKTIQAFVSIQKKKIIYIYISTMIYNWLNRSCE